MPKTTIRLPAPMSSSNSGFDLNVSQSVMMQDGAKAPRGRSKGPRHMSMRKQGTIVTVGGTASNVHDVLLPANILLHLDCSKSMRPSCVLHKQAGLIA